MADSREDTASLLDEDLPAVGLFTGRQPPGASRTGSSRAEPSMGYRMSPLIAEENERRLFVEKKLFRFSEWVLYGYTLACMSIGVVEVSGTNVMSPSEAYTVLFGFGAAVAALGIVLMLLHYTRSRTLPDSAITVGHASIHIFSLLVSSSLLIMCAVWGAKYSASDLSEVGSLSASVMVSGWMSVSVGGDHTETLRISIENSLIETNRLGMARSRWMAISVQIILSNLVCLAVGFVYHLYSVWRAPLGEVKMGTREEGDADFPMRRPGL